MPALDARRGRSTAASGAGTASSSSGRSRRSSPRRPLLGDPVDAASTAQPAVFPLLARRPSESSWLRPGLPPGVDGQRAEQPPHVALRADGPFKLSRRWRCSAADEDDRPARHPQQPDHDRLKEAQRSLGGLAPSAARSCRSSWPTPTRRRRATSPAPRASRCSAGVKCEQRAEDEAFLTLARTLARGRTADPRAPAPAASVAGCARSARCGRTASCPPTRSSLWRRSSRSSRRSTRRTRLATFPVPPSYRRHGSRPSCSTSARCRWSSRARACRSRRAVTVVAAGFVLLGVDQISMEVEQPLGVLPLRALRAECRSRCCRCSRAGRRCRGCG